MRQEVIVVLVAVTVVLAGTIANSQSSTAAGETTSTSFTERGRVSISGRDVDYVIRRLPVSSFPQLPQAVATQLDKLGCLIPQTYGAHHPENVVHASLERPGSSDWAALCSSAGTVKLLIFFASSPESSTVLASESETARLESHDSSGVLGFGWGIDPASPHRIREAQTGMEHHPALLDHDALADTFVEKGTVYHFFTKNAWTVVDTTD